MLFSSFNGVLWGLTVSWLLDSLHLVAGGLVKLHKLGEIELGLFEDLDLLDEHIFEWENLGALFGDGLTNLFLHAIRKYN